jgi:D-alanyl-D-alanine carboxypeptidase/D-alanyl-D-alanine-endopeptidase (penicillin-binding protein 4)
MATAAEPTAVPKKVTESKNPKKKASGKAAAKPAAKAKKPAAAKAKTKKPAAKAKKKAAPKADPLKLPFPENVATLAGSGAVAVYDWHAGPGESIELFSLNPDKPYVPASILKVLTSAAAIEALGPEYRFRTAFYLDRDRNLWVVGRGDPFLVSEELCLIADNLKEKGLDRVKDILVDASFFERGLVLDGTTFTVNPYDAYNSALGANFNTVNFLIDSKGNLVESNPCTPLTPLAKEKAGKTATVAKGKRNKEVRLNIFDSPDSAEANAGQMFRELLVRRDIAVEGEIVTGREMPASGTKLLYLHQSTKNLEEMIRELLKYSNNYVTNQIFLTMGAELYGGPASVEKGQKVVYGFLQRHNLPPITMVEGSGLSRNNSLTARQMSQVLAVFEPARYLIKSQEDGSVYYKTGTMSDIQTLAGYLERPDRPEEPLSFVILLNGRYPQGTREKILEALKAQFVADGKQKKS